MARVDDNGAKWPRSLDFVGAEDGVNDFQEVSHRHVVGAKRYDVEAEDELYIIHEDLLPSSPELHGEFIVL